jgi:hypothetical protein
MVGSRLIADIQHQKANDIIRALQPLSPDERLQADLRQSESVGWLNVYAAGKVSYYFIRDGRLRRCSIKELGICSLNIPCFTLTLGGRSIMGLLDFVGNVVGGAIDIASDVVSGTVDFVVENPGKTILAVGATIATGGLAMVAAPALAATAGGAGLLGAASTGTAISTLSGAALTNASLAAVGGGALAAGGGGMAAGTAVIAGAGAATGAGVSAATIKATS